MWRRALWPETEEAYTGKRRSQRLFTEALWILPIVAVLETGIFFFRWFFKKGGKSLLKKQMARKKKRNSAEKWKTDIPDNTCLPHFMSVDQLQTDSEDQDSSVQCRCHQPTDVWQQDVDHICQTREKTRVWNGLPRLAHSHAQSSAAKTSVDLLSWARRSQWEWTGR